MKAALGNRVWETSTTLGVADMQLLGAEARHQKFVDACGAGATVMYAIVNRDLEEWEVGIGTISDDVPDMLARVEVLDNHLGTNAKINFGAGTKDIYENVAAEKMVALDADTDILTLGGAGLPNINGGANGQYDGPLRLVSHDNESVSLQCYSATGGWCSVATFFRSRSEVKGVKGAVLVGDYIMSLTSWGVAGDGSTVACIGGVSMRVRKVNPTTLGGAYSIELVDDAGVYHSDTVLISYDGGAIFRPKLVALSGSAIGGNDGAALSAQKFIKHITGIVDDVPTPALTITVPNGAHSAAILLTLVAAMGAGGVGACESTVIAQVRIAITRTPGKNAVATLHPIPVTTTPGQAETRATVAGGDGAAFSGVQLSAVSGAMGAANTLTVDVAITNLTAPFPENDHTCLIQAEVLNANANGVTVA